MSPAIVIENPNGSELPDIPEDSPLYPPLAISGSLTHARMLIDGDEADLKRFRREGWLVRWAEAGDYPDDTEAGVTVYEDGSWSVQK
jgi:hypothetical protein